MFRQINGQLGLGAIAHALASQTNTNILSMPNLITLDNEEASIIVGQNVPFITGQFTTQARAARPASTRSRPSSARMSACRCGCGRKSRKAAR